MFQAPVHFGGGRLSGSDYACDAATLFSALFIEALKMGQSDSLLKAARIGELLISDVFPFIGSNHYLPKPMLSAVDRVSNKQSQDAAAESDSVQKKVFKKLKYLPAESYLSYFDGSLDPPSELGRFKLGSAALTTKVNLTRELKDDAEPYHVGGYTFAPGAGLYFILQGEYNIALVLEQLQYSGIGGERSSGYGRFGYEVVDVPADLAALLNSGGEQKILLASSAPKREELTDDLLASAKYALKRRSGFIQSTSHSANLQKKRDFYVFAAGSVFSKTFVGDVFDVNATPDAHPVYRYARAMWMGV
jgi:CRISPR-associated protein Csm4